MKFSTKTVHAGQKPEAITGAIMTPVFMTSTYVQKSPGEHSGYEYSRSGNPTRDALEANLAGLENAKYGHAFASGLAAENTILHMLKSGDHVVCARDVYGGTFRLFEQVWKQLGVSATFVNASSVDEVKSAITPQTRFVWVESPTNPLLQVADLAAIAEIAHQHGAKFIVDNTFATPCLQQPIDLGADIVLHSTTKYLGGHSDVIGGAIAVNDEDLNEQIKFLQNAAGGIPGPMDCFLVLRGTKTLAVRMKQHCENAMQIASHLEQHDEVEKVFYPGLPSDSSHEIANKQMSGFGGIVSVELKGGVERNKKFASTTKLFALAESLGGVESMVNHPSSMTHASIPKAEREKGGLKDSLVRLSVGIEDVGDLIEDLEMAIRESNS